MRTILLRAILAGLAIAIVTTATVLAQSAVPSGASAEAGSRASQAVADMAKQAASSAVDSARKKSAEAAESQAPSLPTGVSATVKSVDKAEQSR